MINYLSKYNYSENNLTQQTISSMCYGPSNIPKYLGREVDLSHSKRSKEDSRMVEDFKDLIFTIN